MVIFLFFGKFRAVAQFLFLETCADNAEATLAHFTIMHNFSGVPLLVQRSAGLWSVGPSEHVAIVLVRCSFGFLQYG